MVLRVPQDHPTIQAAIDAAVDGDTVLVSPGTYVERIDFRSKDITVESTGGPASTIIDGNRLGTVVTISADAAQTPVLRGFTIRNGSEGGVIVSGGPALIEGNRITGNVGCSTFGIAASFSSATIRDNVISDNQVSGCSGGVGGGGVQIGGAGGVQLLDNTITGNVSSSDGGGIALFAAGSPTISGNVISNNTAQPWATGGGISMYNAANALITNNMIFGNSAAGGDGIYWLVPSSEPGPNVVNNTIVGDDSAVFADGFDAGARLTNNIIVGANEREHLGRSAVRRSCRRQLPRPGGLADRGRRAQRGRAGDRHRRRSPTAGRQRRRRPGGRHRSG